MKAYLLFFILFIPGNIFSHTLSEADSLLLELERTSTDTGKVKLLNSIGFNLVNSNLQEAERYVREAFDLAKEIDYQKGLARSYNHLAIIAAYRGQRKEAFTNYYKSLRIDSLINNLSGMAANYNNLGLTYQYLGEKEKAKRYLERSIELYKTAKNESALSRPYSNLANVNKDLGLYTHSLNYHLKSLELDRKFKDKDGISGSLINIGDIYLIQNKLEESYENYLEALNITESINHLQYQTLALSGLANTLKEQGKLSKALEYQQKSLLISRKIEKKYQLDDNYYLLGQIYYGLNDKTKAQDFLGKALKISREMGNNEGIAKAEIAMAKISTENKHYDVAIGKYHTARTHAHAADERILLKEAYSGLSNMYEKTGNLKEALKYLKLYSSLNDSLVKQSSSRQLAELQTIYETDKKDQEINLQKAQLSAQKSLIKQQSLQRNFLIGGAALMVLIFGLSIYVYRNRLKIKELITRSQQETEELRSRFFANISHEFRTPLTLISARIDDFMESSSKENQVDLLSMKKNTIRLLQLVNQLLDLSRIDAGKIPLKVSYGNVSQFIKAFTDSFHSLALQRDITLHSQMNDATIAGYFDPDQVEKVVVNLLSNAFKNTPGGGEIYASVQLIDSKDILLNVKDTGVGIPKEDIAQIFDRFYQSSHSENNGSGVGLSLTRELIELYRGSIEVESELGKGSSFTVKLPIDRDTMVKLGAEISDELLSQTENKNHPIEPDTGYHGEKQQLIFPEGRPSILVVEDNSELRNYIVDFLSSEYQVIEASNGKFGLEYAIEYQPDMILSDVMMPEMDGIELCKKIKDTVETSHIPFIMLTAKASGEDKLEGLDLGADDYLIKPFDKKELKVRIKNLIIQRKKLIEKFSQSLNPRDIKLNSADEKFMTRVGLIVKEHLSDESFSVEVFSKIMAMSRTQLFRKIRSLTGMSVSEYMRVIRLNHAAEMLKNKTASVSEIAYDVGFNNLSYFTKCFKERYGVNPSDYS